MTSVKIAPSEQVTGRVQSWAWPGERMGKAMNVAASSPQPGLRFPGQGLCWLGPHVPPCQHRRFRNYEQLSLKITTVVIVRLAFSRVPKLDGGKFCKPERILKLRRNVV